MRHSSNQKQKQKTRLGIANRAIPLDIATDTADDLICLPALRVARRLSLCHLFSDPFHPSLRADVIHFLPQSAAVRCQAGWRVGLTRVG